MSHKSKPSKSMISGDSGNKKMILELDPAKHAFIKRIAESADMAQPKVVNLILAKIAADVSPEVYIDEIKRQHAAEQMKALDERQRQLDQEKQRLKDLLED